MAINGMSGPGASAAAGNPGGNNGMNYIVNPVYPAGQTFANTPPSYTRRIAWRLAQNRGYPAGTTQVRTSVGTSQAGGMFPPSQQVYYNDQGQTLGMTGTQTGQTHANDPYYNTFQGQTGGGYNSATGQYIPKGPK